MIRAFLAILSLLMVLGSYEAQAQSVSLDRLSSSMKVGEAIQDVMSWIGARPEPSPEFGYSNNRRFDMQLHESLKADLEMVNVTTQAQFTRNAFPERMQRWVDAVQDSGGHVSTCVQDTGTRGIFALLKLLYKGFQRYRDWQLYKPARNYNLTVLVGPENGSVLNLVFTLRSTEVQCPAGFKAYEEQEEPKK